MNQLTHNVVDTVDAIQSMCQSIRDGNVARIYIDIELVQSLSSNVMYPSYIIRI